MSDPKDMRGSEATPDGGIAPELASFVDAEARLVEATQLAWRWHGHETRKGKAVSYMSHLLQVEGLVLNAGGGPDEAIAALLHDALEDAEDADERATREREIRTRFGADVLRIVLDCTDTTPEEAGRHKGPWRKRKERYIEQLRRADRGSRLVAVCDKRHNLADLVSDLRADGPAVLNRFNADGVQQLWYYESVIEVCRSVMTRALADELDELLEQLRSLIDLQIDAQIDGK